MLKWEDLLLLLPAFAVIIFLLVALNKIMPAALNF